MCGAIAARSTGSGPDGPNADRGIDTERRTGARHLALAQQRDQHREVLPHVAGRLVERQVKHALDHHLVGERAVVELMERQRAGRFRLPG
jgi:hypothetical protein